MRLNKEYKIRGVEENDHHLIMNSWLSNMRNCVAFSGAIDSFLDRQRERINKLFDRDTVRIRVACATDDDDEMFGFIVSEPETNVVHYCYVKHAFQKWGIGRQLLSAATSVGIVTITQYSYDLKAMRKAGKLPSRIIYNPYWFEEQK
jgi:hypothetical protein